MGFPRQTALSESFQFYDRSVSTMNEVILAKYGELILKGSNRSSFEAMLLREVRRLSLIHI